MIGDTKEIIVTGGPCAGKTEGLLYVAEELGKMGIRTFVVPEVATELMKSAGVSLPDLRVHDPRAYYEAERQILLQMRTRRKEYRDLARIFPSDRKIVILFDRGPMDCLAYMPQAFFKAILEDERLTLFDARDSYDAVIHLVTAADGAEAFYTRENNTARSESVEEARVLDQKTLRAWIGHPHLRIIDNSTDFAGKKKRFLREVLKIVSPTPLEIERRFLLKRTPNFLCFDEFSNKGFLIEQIYCMDALHNSFRIRKRTRGHYSHYTKTVKLDVSPGVRSEVEEPIGAMEYLHLGKSKISQVKMVRKFRYYFVYASQQFELDVFLSPVSNVCILEIELADLNDPVTLPDFLEIEKEITDDPRFSNFAIASKSAHR